MMELKLQDVKFARTLEGLMLSLQLPLLKLLSEEDFRNQMSLEYESNLEGVRQKLVSLDYSTDARFDPLRVVEAIAKYSKAKGKSIDEFCVGSCGDLNPNCDSSLGNGFSLIESKYGLPVGTFDRLERSASQSWNSVGVKKEYSVGLFGLNKHTAKRIGLKYSCGEDQRKDVALGAEAVAKYLSQVNKKGGDLIVSLEQDFGTFVDYKRIRFISDVIHNRVQCRPSNVFSIYVDMKRKEPKVCSQYSKFAEYTRAINDY